MRVAGSIVNADSVEYWKAASEGQLLFQKCLACGAVQFPPRHHCATCWKGELEWIKSGGMGVVESFTIVRRPPLPELHDMAPYVVASVIVEEGPRMITNIIGNGSLDVQIGDPVMVTFCDDGAGHALPQFRRT